MQNGTTVRDGPGLCSAHHQFALFINVILTVQTSWDGTGQELQKRINCKSQRALLSESPNQTASVSAAVQLMLRRSQIISCLNFHQSDLNIFLSSTAAASRAHGDCSIECYSTLLYCANILGSEYTMMLSEIILECVLKNLPQVLCGLNLSVFVSSCGPDWTRDVEFSNLLQDVLVVSGDGSSWLWL